eukprot:3512938-Rhodomonas_salina.3
MERATARFDKEFAPRVQALLDGCRAALLAREALASFQAQSAANMEERKVFESFENAYTELRCLLNQRKGKELSLLSEYDAWLKDAKGRNADPERKERIQKDVADMLDKVNKGMKSIRGNAKKAADEVRGLLQDRLPELRKQVQDLKSEFAAGIMSVEGSPNERVPWKVRRRWAWLCCDTEPPLLRAAATLHLVICLGALLTSGRAGGGWILGGDTGVAEER